jgi:hypothetical protein
LHLPLKDFKGEIVELTVNNTLANHNGAPKDSPKEIIEKE